MYYVTCFKCDFQGRMFRCSAECCERTTDSMSQVHECIERCHTPLAKAQGLVTNELEKFQVGAQQCITKAVVSQERWHEVKII